MDNNSPLSAPSVNLSPEAERENTNAPDFVLNPERENKPAPKMSVEQNQNYMPAHIINENVEFRPYKEHKVIEDQRQAKLGTLTDQILSMHVDAMKKYRRAKKRLKNLTQDELENPTERTVKDRKILRKGPPITKAEAKAQAYEQLVRYGG
jgi:hypothetical protein